MWREPTSRIPLRWGTHRERWAGGLLLIVAGAAALAGTNTYTLALGVTGWLAHFAGWAIMPAAGWRRIVAATASSAALVFVLAGPRFLLALTVSYAAWLLVRHRPLAAVPTVAFVMAGAVVIARVLPDAWLAASTAWFAVAVVSAWSARLVHAQSRRSVAGERPAREAPGSLQSS